MNFTAREREASSGPPLRWAEPVILAAIVLAFAAIEIWVDARRPLWFDEVGSLVVSTRPSLREMFRVILRTGTHRSFFARPPLHCSTDTPRDRSLIAVNSGYRRYGSDDLCIRKAGYTQPLRLSGNECVLRKPIRYVCFA